METKTWKLAQGYMENEDRDRKRERERGKRGKRERGGKERKEREREKRERISNNLGTHTSTYIDWAGEKWMFLDVVGAVHGKFKR